MTARERLDRVDAAWLQMDRPGNTADIVALIALDGPLRLERLRRVITHRLVCHERFRQRVVAGPGGGPQWEPDPRFSVARHVRRLAAAPGDSLERLAGEIASAPLDANRPPWRAWLLTRGGESFLFVKVHHCVGDGFALVSLLLSMVDEPAVAGRIARRLPAAPAPAPWRAADALGAATGAVGAGLAFARSLLGMVTLPLAPATPPPAGERRTAFTRPWPLRDIRATAREAGATVNDVLLAALAGALGDTLAPALGAAGHDLRALVPVNLRAARPDPDALGNRFGLVFVDLPASSPAPADRLARVRTRLRDLKRSPDARVTMAVLGALGLAPPALERLGTEFFSRKASLVVTNVPGPKRKLHLGGRRIERLVFWVPHPASLGVGVSFFSYAGEVTMGVRADAAILPDPAAVARAFEAELTRVAPRRNGKLANGAAAHPLARTILAV